MFDKQRSWLDLTKQCDLGPRKPGTAAHLACRDLIYKELQKTCENVRLQPFSHTWSRTGKAIKMWNVIGEQNWKNAKVRVALFAHWDTRPTADMEQDAGRQSLPIPGANDGASGVAVLLELARALKAKPAEVGVLYVFVDGEDLGPDLDEMFLGARVFAKDMGTPKPHYGILLDMIGNKDVRVPKEPNSVKFAPDLVKQLYIHAANVGLRSSFPNELGPTIEDDHIPLNEAGLPTVDLIDFNYGPWHTLGDTPDKCSADSLGKLGLLLETWLRKPEPFVISKS